MSEPFADRELLRRARCAGSGLVRRLSLDEVVRRHTASAGIVELCLNPGGSPTYRPSIYDTRTNHEKRALADAYDRVQTARGDARRAWRG
jgi:hypothetical protein